MGYQIIKQPNGQLALFSNGSETFVMWDASRSDVLGFFVEESTAETRRWVKRALKHVEKDDPHAIYHQFALTWEEAKRRSRKSGLDITDPSTHLPDDEAVKRHNRHLKPLAKAAKAAAGDDRPWSSLPEPDREKWRTVAAAVLAAQLSEHDDE